MKHEAQLIAIRSIISDNGSMKHKEIPEHGWSRFVGDTSSKGFGFYFWSKRRLGYDWTSGVTLALPPRSEIESVLNKRTARNYFTEGQISSLLSADDFLSFLEYDRHTAPSSSQAKFLRNLTPYDLLDAWIRNRDLIERPRVEDITVRNNAWGELTFTQQRGFTTTAYIPNGDVIAYFFNDHKTQQVSHAAFSSFDDGSVLHHLEDSGVTWSEFEKMIWLFDDGSMKDFGNSLRMYDINTRGDKVMSTQFNYLRHAFSDAGITAIELLSWCRLSLDHQVSAEAAIEIVQSGLTLDAALT
jgi:hypothetical protein